VLFFEILFDPARSAPRHFVAAVVLLALGAPWLRRRIERDDSSPGSDAELNGET
jgi:MYXO-CTERM domain-containing protein